MAVRVILPEMVTPARSRKSLSGHAAMVSASILPLCLAVKASRALRMAAGSRSDI
jgi:hypothetical protein